MPPDRERELDRLRREAAGCRRCDLWRRATQTVFGDGPSRARLMLVGEQPGDQEDKAGEPFVGPAGTLLREALEEAGLGREEILACRAWLDEEIALIKPAAIVALGATAASVVIGSKAKVLRDRGRLFESPLAPIVTLTVHPSSILRAPDADARRAARAAFVKDLKAIAKRLKQ